MKRKQQIAPFGLRLAALGLLAPLFAVGCRNPGEEGQGQTHTRVTPDNQPPAHPENLPPPPTADQIDPSSPRAVLGGTSTTRPAAQNSAGH